MTPLEFTPLEFTPLEFTPLAAPFGAEVLGLDLDRLDDNRPDNELAATLTSELERHAVLVIRTSSLSPTELLRFAGLFGEVERADDGDQTHRDHPEIAEWTNVSADDRIVVDATRVADNLKPRWYAEGSFRPVPPRFSMMYAVEVAQRGGQTQFADMHRALRLLPPEDVAEIARLRLVHCSDTHPDALVERPWLRTIGDGSVSLYMGTYASHIVGRDAAESQQWFAEIEAQLPVHDVFCEHRWQPHDVVVFDNRTIMHRTLGYDIQNERRVLHRVQVAGNPMDWPTIASDQPHV